MSDVYDNVYPKVIDDITQILLMSMVVIPLGYDNVCEKIHYDVMSDDLCPKISILKLEMASGRLSKTGDLLQH